MPFPRIYTLILTVLLLAAQLGTIVHALEHDYGHHEHQASCDLFIAAQHSAAAINSCAEAVSTSSFSLWYNTDYHFTSLAQYVVYQPRAPPAR